MTEPLPLNVRFPVDLYDGSPSIMFTATLSDADAKRLAATDPRKVRVLGDLMICVHDAVRIAVQDEL